MFRSIRLQIVSDSSVQFSPFDFSENLDVEVSIGAGSFGSVVSRIINVNPVARPGPDPRKRVHSRPWWPRTSRIR